MFETDPSSLTIAFRALALAAMLTLAAPFLRAQEAPIVSLKDAVNTEVQERTFTLPRASKVHVYAKGGSASHSTFFAYGWILNATTRELVWQMDGRTSRPQGAFQVADQYLDLPKGTYEAYYSNHGFGWGGLFSHGTRNIDRRKVKAPVDPKEHERHWFRNTFEALLPGRVSDWQAQAGSYGMEIYLPASEAGAVTTSSGPLAWRNEVVSLLATGDDGEWKAGFRLKRAVTLHVYAQGERAGRNEMVDEGWILDARTRKRVWEMDGPRSQYGGGAEKNRRQVETIQLPAGDYEAVYVTDGTHSPADWNSAPPCDPLRYGLILSVPKDEEVSAVVAHPIAAPSGKLLASLVRVGNDRHERATFTLGAASRVRIYALGEADDDEMADYGWIEDAQGAKVWTMRRKETRPAGGASKNRLSDLLLDLPKGTYTLHYRTDGSHAYGDWNDDAPRDAEHYGATVYAEE